MSEQKFVGEYVEIDFGTPTEVKDARKVSITNNEYPIIFKRGAIGLHCASAEEIDEITNILIEKGSTFGGFSKKNNAGMMVLVK